MANRYLGRLPEDMVPYWDFDAPSILIELKDASALHELSTMGDNKQLKDKHRSVAEKLMAPLSEDKYQSKGQNNAFLLHSMGH